MSTILKPNIPVALCCDHAGYATKQAVMKYLDEQAIAMVKEFLSTDFEGGRHQRRIDKIPVK